MSQLAEQLIEESLVTKNPRLDLGNCGLKGEEPCLSQLATCTHLKTLVFSDCGKKNLQELAEKQNLEEIKLNIWDFGTNHSTFFLRKGLSFEIRVNAKNTIQTTTLCEAFLSCHFEELWIFYCSLLLSFRQPMFVFKHINQDDVKYSATTLN